VIDAVIGLYLNFFVLIAQLFGKVPALKALAPTQTEAPFKVAQFTALVAFLLLGIFATRGVRNEQLRTAWCVAFASAGTTVFPSFRETEYSTVVSLRR